MKGRFGPPFFWLQHREPGEVGEGEGQGVCTLVSTGSGMEQEEILRKVLEAEQEFSHDK